MDFTLFQELDELANQRLAEMAAAGRWRGYEGDETDQLKDLLCKQLEQPLVRLCASGTAATELALRAAQVNAEDRVLLSGYDFPGNFRAVESVGARPVLMDMEPDRWVVSCPKENVSVKAVILSPLYGTVPDMQGWRNWCDRYGIKLILDACQCPGAKQEDETGVLRPLSLWADVTCLSFGGSKILTAGRGGAVAMNDPASLLAINRFTDRGNDYSPLSLMQAAVLIPQLESLDKLNGLRRQLIRQVEQVASEFRSLNDPMPTVDEVSWLPVHYKKAWLVPGLEQRDKWLAEAMNRDLPFGAGFRGFAKRSSRRCDVVGELTRCLQASEQVILLHHDYLPAAARANGVNGIEAGKQKLFDFFSWLSRA